MESLFDARFKVLGPECQSAHGGTGTWRKGQWRSVHGKLVPCSNGIHYCRADQLVRWLGPTIWLFEDGTPDETIDHGDKLVTRRGRIVERLTTWNDTTARLFAADCGEAVVHLIPESHRAPFVAAIATARGFARGEIDEKELAVAWHATWVAPWAAHGAAAAWVAARDAARAASWAAASWAAAAGRDAAGAAARRSQTALLFEYLNGEKS